MNCYRTVRDSYRAYLDHPYRLIFESADEPIPTKSDGGIDWTKVTAVRILGVEDTHE